MFDVLLMIHTILVLCLIGIILVQRSDDSGLGLGGGGGGGAGQFMTGRASANLLTRATSILATLFILSSLGLAIMSGNQARTSIVDHIEGAAPHANTDAAPLIKEEAPLETLIEPMVPRPGDEEVEPTVPKPE